MTCGTPELSWRTGGAKAMTETKLPVPSANAFQLRLSQERMSYYHSPLTQLIFSFACLVGKLQN